MKTLIVGMGEVGSALHSILKGYYEVHTYDAKDGPPIIPESCDIEIMHICIPWSEGFMGVVNYWNSLISPKYIVIHSSVPVGVCERLDGVVFHSPVRGTHPDMKEGMLAYVKYIGYEPDDAGKIKDVVDYFESADITIKPIIHTRTTELMKLLELCRYGTYIAFAKEQENICKAFQLDYNLVVNDYEETRNEGMKALGRDELCQPILYPFKDYVSGHCTVEDMEILLNQIKSPLLEQAYKIDRATKIWPNSNIYPTAKIGKGCSIGQFCEIGENVVIGNNVRIGAFTFIPEGVVIEDNVFIAPRVSFSNDKYPPAGKESWGKILVKKGAVIGMGATILPCVTIGEKSVVGAGSVVTKDVPNNEVWYGTAAYAHGKREEVYK